MTDAKLPLGQPTDYADQYDPELLYPIARSDSRQMLDIDALPFQGTDIWNAWELTWLSESGLPMVATAEIRIPAESTNLIESKSLKLYLNSFAMSACPQPDEVRDRIERDLSQCAGGAVTVALQTPQQASASRVSELAGDCLDSLAVNCSVFDVDAELLRADKQSIVEESLHTHLLRSLCPVTAQPDMGSLFIRYTGPKIDRGSLLQYIVSYRAHNDFHEACVERMFVDIQRRCDTQQLTLHARYQRRGGLDINPFRSNFESDPDNLRLWRQ